MGSIDRRIVIGAVVALVLLMLIRTPLARFVFPVLVTVVILGFLYLLYSLVMQVRRFIQLRRRRNTTESRIQERLEHCRELLKKNQNEQSEILSSIRELQSGLDRLADPTSRQRREAGDVLSAYQREYQLRKAKSSFYQRCIIKLESLLHSQQLGVDLEQKKKRLKELQEGQYEELADMEAMKSELEMEVHYLDTIESLSLKMLSSTTVDDAENLRLELEEMTRELDEI